MACDRSLAALGVDVIDLYQVHWPVDGVAAEETIGALLDLRDAGKVRAIGVSNYHLADLEAAGAVAAIDSFQPGYHLMRRDIERRRAAVVRRERRRRDRLRPPRPRPAHRQDDAPARRSAPTTGAAQSELFADDAFPERIAVVGELAEIARESGRPGGVAELSVAWVLRRPGDHRCDHRRAIARAGGAQRRARRRARSARTRSRRSTRCSPAIRRRRAPTATASLRIGDRTRQAVQCPMAIAGPRRRRSDVRPPTPQPFGAHARWHRARRSGGGHPLGGPRPRCGQAQPAPDDAGHARGAAARGRGRVRARRRPGAAHGPRHRRRLARRPGQPRRAPHRRRRPQLGAGPGAAAHAPEGRRPRPHDHGAGGPGPGHRRRGSCCSWRAEDLRPIATGGSRPR